MKIQAAVFFGGRSVEHEVSVVSGMQVIAALDKEKYDPVAVYISKDGAFYTGDEFAKIESYKHINRLLDGGKQVSPVRIGGKVALVPVVKKMFGKDAPVYIDVALPVVHGALAEDGSFQGFLEILGIPYCGSDVLSSAICMDKALAKAMLRRAELPVLPDVVVGAKSYHEKKGVTLNAIETMFPYPVIVKPVNLSSGIGVSKADNRGKLEAAIEAALMFSESVIIEPFIIHLREINVSVLGNTEKARASVCGEPVGQEEILKDKRNSAKARKPAVVSPAQSKAPAMLAEEQAGYVREMAVSAFRLLGCSGLCRVDFLFDTLKEAFYINDLNTIPALLSSHLWEATGLSFSSMLDELIELAFERWKSKNAPAISGDTGSETGDDL